MLLGVLAPASPEEDRAWTEPDQFRIVDDLRSYGSGTDGP